MMTAVAREISIDFFIDLNIPNVWFCVKGILSHQKKFSRSVIIDRGRFG